jgi:nicotinamidase/pyrazinamidase
MKVFVSHHHKDIDFARLLASRLKSASIDAWLAATNLAVGMSWGEEIDHALYESWAVVVVLSKNTRRSEYVTYEWAFAMGMQKPIVPVLLTEGSQHPKLESLHYMDFSNKGAEPWDELIACLSAFGDPRRMTYDYEQVKMLQDDARSRQPRIAKKPTKASAGSKPLRDILVVVDIQNDFFPSGPLTAADTESLLGPLNKAIVQAQALGMVIVFTRDWHPPNHSSFAENGGKWPRHCLQGSEGAKFPEALIVPEGSITVNIGEAPTSLGYSPFEDPALEKIINSVDIGTVFVAGIALEYCVQATCLEARQRRKRVVLCRTLVRPATDLASEINQTIAHLTESGVEVSEALVPFEVEKASVLGWPAVEARRVT